MVCAGARGPACHVAESQPSKGTRSPAGDTAPAGCEVGLSCNSQCPLRKRKRTLRCLDTSISCWSQHFAHAHLELRLERRSYPSPGRRDGTRRGTSERLTSRVYAAEEHFTSKCPANAIFISSTCDGTLLGSHQLRHVGSVPFSGPWWKR